MSYFQAMETPVIYKHRVAVGLGVENFLGVPFLSLDTHAAVQLEEDKCFGSGQVGIQHGFYQQSALGTSLGSASWWCNTIHWWMCTQLTIQKQQFHHST